VDGPQGTVINVKEGRVQPGNESQNFKKTGTKHKSRQKGNGKNCRKRGFPTKIGFDDFQGSEKKKTKGEGDCLSAGGLTKGANRFQR